VVQLWVVTADRAPWRAQLDNDAYWWHFPGPAPATPTGRLSGANTVCIFHARRCAVDGSCAPESRRTSDRGMHTHLAASSRPPRFSENFHFGPSLVRAGVRLRYLDGSVPRRRQPPGRACGRTASEWPAGARRAAGGPARPPSVSIPLGAAYGVRRDVLRRSRRASPRSRFPSAPTQPVALSSPARPDSLARPYKLLMPAAAGCPAGRRRLQSSSPVSFQPATEARPAALPCRSVP